MQHTNRQKTTGISGVVPQFRSATSLLVRNSAKWSTE